MTRRLILGFIAGITGCFYAARDAAPCDASRASEVEIEAECLLPNVQLLQKQVQRQRTPVQSRDLRPDVASVTISTHVLAEALAEDSLNDETVDYQRAMLVGKGEVQDNSSSQARSEATSSSNFAKSQLPSIEDVMKQLKQRLPVNAVGEVRIGVIVPSTSNISNPISAYEFMNRRESVQQYLTKLYGGSTADVAQYGSYIDNSSTIVYEEVSTVVSYTHIQTLFTTAQELFPELQRWCREWEQDSIGLELNGALLRISSSAFDPTSIADIMKQLLATMR
jgi:hypothetical protein